MKANEYQMAALRTAKVEDDQLLIECALGLAGEVGELIDHIKKHKFHGHKLDCDYIKKELGDIVWYAAVMAYKANLSFDGVLEGNVEKLLKRYPNGFESDKSINRSE